MAFRFTVRVLIQDEKDYEELHRYMSEEGFTKFIVASNGVQYKLPPAEYNFIGEATAEHVLEKAKRAASRTEKDFQVLVSPCELRLWFGLDKANVVERILEASYRL